MKKVYIALALLAAFVATAGQLRHPANPLTGAGKAMLTQKDLPFPICPPDCDFTH
jgi:hypothetical protein